MAQSMRIEERYGKRRSNAFPPHAAEHRSASALRTLLAPDVPFLPESLRRAASPSPLNGGVALSSLPPRHPSICSRRRSGRRNKWVSAGMSTPGIRARRRSGGRPSPSPSLPTSRPPPDPSFSSPPPSTGTAPSTVGPVLLRAIHRYKNCWLPLLAKHQNQQHNLESDVPLTVPLDCEWIWHCHRLNPVQYKKDCQLVYGRILDNANVRSTTEVTVEDSVTDLMWELWGIEYPGEPFEIDYEVRNVDEVIDGELAVADAQTFSYDLAVVVKRQSSFYYQVSRSAMQDQRFLEAAVARYKGFLHLIRRNKERSVDHFAVPTYDVDLIWHSHQLHPMSYCNDFMKLLGIVLVHNDMDSYGNEGKKLDVEFTMTTRLWEEMFGSRYLRAGAMYRGSIPSPVINSPLKCTSDAPNVQSSHQKHLQLQQTKFIEVFLEVLDVKNIPDSKKGSMFVSFSKNNPDPFLIGDSCLSIRSETGKRNIGSFQCDPTGDLILTLLSKTMSSKSDCKLEEAIGTITISLHDIMQGNSELSIDKWFQLQPKSENDSSDPMFLHVAASCTLPAPAPYVFYLAKWPGTTRNSFSPSIGNEQQLKHSSCFIDSNGSEVMKIFMRILRNRGTKGSSRLKQVVGLIGDSGKSRVLAELTGNAWSFTDLKLVLSFDKNVHEEGNVFELQGDYKMKLFPGKRLEFEATSTKKDSCDFITVVQFSVNEPYGKALALINVKTGLLKVNEEWFMLPGLVLTFILWSTLKSNVPSFHLSHEEDPVEERTIPCTTYLNMAVDGDNSEDCNMFDLHCPLRCGVLILLNQLC